MFSCPPSFEQGRGVPLSSGYLVGIEGGCLLLSRIEGGPVQEAIELAVVGLLAKKTVALAGLKGGKGGRVLAGPRAQTHDPPDAA